MMGRGTSQETSATAGRLPAGQSPGDTQKHHGYVGIDLSSIYQLAEPDGEPLPNMTRALLDWTGRRWAEIDPATGEVMAEGEEG